MHAHSIMRENLQETFVTIETPGGPMKAFQVLPDDESLAGIVVEMEAFGVNDHIREVCRRLAREGYAVLAPDMYHRTGELLTYAYDDSKRREPFSELTNAGIEADVSASLEHLARLPQVDGTRIGIIGFCVGGFMAFLATCRTNVATAICLYGGGIVNRREGLKLEPLLSEAGNIKVPVLCMFGDKDTSIPIQEVQAIRTRLAVHERGHEVVVYEGAEHGFFCDERGSYNPEAAKDAWQRIRKWLELRLKALQEYPTED